MQQANAKGVSEAVDLARQLIQLDTTNPPGNESRAARFIAERLERIGVRAELHALSSGRESLIARLPGKDDEPALCFCGHLDTVPVGAAPWSRDPFSGAIEGDRLWGRGSSDMKGGIAAMVVAFERFHRSGMQAPITLVLSASEETGCQGASAIADKIGSVGAMIIGEPTQEQVVIAHKGVLWLRLKASGRAAHGSRPELGANAIQRMIDAIVALRDLRFDVEPHAILGTPSASVGTIAGGVATNIVADSCQATLDVRLVPGLDVAGVIAAVQMRLGSDIEVEPILALEAVESRTDHPWILAVCSDAQRLCGAAPNPRGATFFTDASVLAPTLGFPPIALIGPGDPALAHQADEWCSIGAIDRVTHLYEKIATQWQPSRVGAGRSSRTGEPIDELSHPTSDSRHLPIADPTGFLGN